MRKLLQGVLLLLVAAARLVAVDGARASSVTLTVRVRPILSKAGHDRSDSEPSPAHAYQLDFLTPGLHAPPRFSACGLQNHWLAPLETHESVSGFLDSSLSVDGGEESVCALLHPRALYPSPLGSSSSTDDDSAVLVLSSDGPLAPTLRALVAKGALPLPLRDNATPRNPGEASIQVASILVAAPRPGATHVNLVISGDAGGFSFCPPFRDDEGDAIPSLASLAPRCEGLSETEQSSPCIAADERLAARCGLRGPVSLLRVRLDGAGKAEDKKEEDEEEGSEAVLLERSSAAMPPLLLEQHLGSMTKARHANRLRLRAGAAAARAAMEMDRPFLVGAASAGASKQKEDKAPPPAPALPAPPSKDVTAPAAKAAPPSASKKARGDFVPSQRLLASGLYLAKNNPCHSEVGRLVMCVKAEGTASRCKAEQRDYMRCQRKKALGTDDFTSAMGENANADAARAPASKRISRTPAVKQEEQKEEEADDRSTGSHLTSAQANAGDEARFAKRQETSQQQQHALRSKAKAESGSTAAALTGSGGRAASRMELDILEEASERLGMPMEELEAMCSAMEGGVGDCPVSTALLGTNPVPGGANTMPGMGGAGPFGPDLSSAAGLVIGAILQGIVGPEIIEFSQNLVTKMMTVVPPVLVKTMVDGSDPLSSLPAMPPIPNPAELAEQAMAAAEAAKAMAEAQLEQSMAAAQMAKDQANEQIANAKAAAEELKALQEQAAALQAEKMAEAKELADQAKQAADEAAAEAKAAAEESAAQAQSEFERLQQQAMEAIGAAKDEAMAALENAKALKDAADAEVAQVHSVILENKPELLLKGDAALKFGTLMGNFKATVDLIATIAHQAGLAVVGTVDDIRKKIETTPLDLLKHAAGEAKLKADTAKEHLKKRDKPPHLRPIIIPGMVPLGDLATHGKRSDDPLVISQLLKDKLPSALQLADAGREAAKKKLEEVKEAKLATLSALAAVRAADEQLRRAKEEADTIREVLREQNRLSKDRWDRIQGDEKKLKLWRAKVQQEDEASSPGAVMDWTGGFTSGTPPNITFNDPDGRIAAEAEAAKAMAEARLEQTDEILKKAEEEVKEQTERAKLADDVLEALKDQAAALQAEKLTEGKTLIEEAKEQALKGAYERKDRVEDEATKAREEVKRAEEEVQKAQGTAKTEAIVVLDKATGRRDALEAELVDIRRAINNNEPEIVLKDDSARSYKSLIKVYTTTVEQAATIGSQAGLPGVTTVEDVRRKIDSTPIEDLKQTAVQIRSRAEIARENIERNTPPHLRPSITTMGAIAGVGAVGAVGVVGAVSGGTLGMTHLLNVDLPHARRRSKKENDERKRKQEKLRKVKDTHSSAKEAVRSSDEKLKQTHRSNNNNRVTKTEHRGPPHNKKETSPHHNDRRSQTDNHDRSSPNQQHSPPSDNKEHRSFSGGHTSGGSGEVKVQHRPVPLGHTPPGQDRQMKNDRVRRKGSVPGTDGRDDKPGDLKSDSTVRVDDEGQRAPQQQDDSPRTDGSAGGSTPPEEQDNKKQSTKLEDSPSTQGGGTDAPGLRDKSDRSNDRRDSPKEELANDQPPPTDGTSAPPKQQEPPPKDTSGAVQDNGGSPEPPPQKDESEKKQTDGSTGGGGSQSNPPGGEDREKPPPPPPKKKKNKGPRKGQLAVILHNDLSHSLTTMLTRSLTESFSDELIPQLHDSIEPVLRRELGEALPPRLHSTLHTVMTRAIVDAVPPLVVRTLPGFVSAAVTDVLIRSLTETISRVVVATTSEAVLYPPELLQCCETCKLTGAQAACQCCSSTPAERAAVALNLQGTITRHYAGFYGNYTASNAAEDFKAGTNGAKKDDKGKKGGKK